MTTVSRRGQEEQWLDTATENVKKQSFFMKRALDTGDLSEALKCASSMLGELRTNELSPQHYYELYMDISNELHELEMHFEDEDKKEQGRSIVEMYERVQYAGNIVPRMYLLVTVGSAYIKTKKAPAKDILFDMVELCKGVQHPMRGLFLRNYLSQVTKDKIPDVGSPYESEAVTVKDGIDFVLQNFTEMNKLWVRMQHQGAVKNKKRREKERQNLRQLVGTNLVRLSMLRGVDLKAYKEMVLPRVLKQVVSCKDVIAQEYLMECIIQVFPDDFHLDTLDVFLGTLETLQKRVNTNAILIALMNRLSKYALANPDKIPAELEMFPMFHKYSARVLKQKTNMSLFDKLHLQVALVRFSSSVYPKVLEYIDLVLAFSVDLMKMHGQSVVPPDCVKPIVQLLTLPLDALGVEILNLEAYGPLMKHLGFAERLEVAESIVGAVVKLDVPLCAVDQVDQLLEYISPLLKDQKDRPESLEEDPDDFDQQQTSVAQMFHNL